MGRALGPHKRGHFHLWATSAASLSSKSSPLLLRRLTWSLQQPTCSGQPWVQITIVLLAPFHQPRSRRLTINCGGHFLPYIVGWSVIRQVSKDRLQPPLPPPSRTTWNGTASHSTQSPTANPPIANAPIGKPHIVHPHMGYPNTGPRPTGQPPIAQPPMPRHPGDCPHEMPSKEIPSCWTLDHPSISTYSKRVCTAASG